MAVVHCREIERRFLDRALAVRLGEGVELPVIDTMELEARLHRRARPGLLARILGRQAESLSIRLADCRARYHLPRYRAHHALTDALATAELLQAQLAHRFAPDYRAHHALTDALATAELLQAQLAHRFAPDTPLRELWQ